MHSEATADFHPVVSAEVQDLSQKQIPERGGACMGTTPAISSRGQPGL